MQVTHLTVLLVMAMALAIAMNLSVGEPMATIPGEEIANKTFDWDNLCGFTPSWDQTCALGVSTPYMGADHVGVLVIETDMDGVETFVSARGFYPKHVLGLGGMGSFILSFVLPVPGELRQDKILAKAIRSNATLAVRWVAEPSYRTVLRSRAAVPLLYHPLGLMPLSGNCVTAARTSWSRFTGDSIPIGWVVTQYMGWAACLAVLWYVGSRNPRVLRWYAIVYVTAIGVAMLR